MRPRITSLRFTHTFFHATVESNMQSILDNGLLVSERSVNEFGLDTGLDYHTVYGADVNKYTKPKCIHLTENYNQAELYRGIIQDSFGQEAVILKVTISSSDTMEKDKEDPESYICLNDIPKNRISLFQAAPNEQDEEKTVRRDVRSKYV